MPSNPSVAGMMLGQTLIGIREKMIGKDILSDDTIWAEDRGVLDHAVMSLADRLSEHGYDVTPESLANLQKQTATVLQKYDDAGKQAANEAKPKPAYRFSAHSALAPITEETTDGIA